jgi:hypothetical protein
VLVAHRVIVATVLLSTARHQLAFAQDGEIRGRVVDAASQAPIATATIEVTTTGQVAPLRIFTQWSRPSPDSSNARVWRPSFSCSPSTNAASGRLGYCERTTDDRRAATGERR